VDRIQLGWTGEAAVAGVQLAARDSAGQPAVSAQSVTWDGGLLGLLRGVDGQLPLLQMMQMMHLLALMSLLDHAEHYRPCLQHRTASAHQHQGPDPGWHA
jgi:hypothetical protein